MCALMPPMSQVMSLALFFRHQNVCAPPPPKKKLFRGATAPLRRLCVRMRVQDCCVGLGEVVTVELKSNVKLRHMLSTSIITVIIYTITIGCCEKLIPGCFRKFGPGFGFRFFYLLVSGSHYYSKVSIEHKLFIFVELCSSI